MPHPSTSRGGGEPAGRGARFPRFFSGRDSPWQTTGNALHKRPGRAGPVCRRAFARFTETWRLDTHSFWMTDLKEAEARLHFSFGARGFRRFPEARPVQDCRRRVFAGLMGTACTDGEDRFRAKRPRDRFEPREPGATSVAPWGAGFESVVLSRLSAQRRARPGQGGRSQPAVPAMLTGRKPERACSGSSG
jgi:hypothetical protein